LNRQEARVATTISVKEALRQERPFRGGGSLLFNSGGVDRQVVFTKAHFHAMQPAEISPHHKKILQTLHAMVTRRKRCRKESPCSRSAVRVPKAIDDDSNAAQNKSASPMSIELIWGIRGKA